MEALKHFRTLITSELTEEIKFDIIAHAKPAVVLYLSYIKDRDIFLGVYENYILEDYSLESTKQLITFTDYLIEKYEFVEQARKNIVWESYKPAGGQHVGHDSSVTLVSSELSISLRIQQYRQQLKNRNLALLLFEAALEDYCNTHFKYQT